MTRSNSDIIASSMAVLDRLHAAKLTDAQLAVNIATYRNTTGANARWLAACVDERGRRRPPTCDIEGCDEPAVSVWFDDETFTDWDICEGCAT